MKITRTLLLGLFTSALASASTLKIEPFQAIGFDKERSQVAQELVKGEIEAQSDYKIVEAKDPADITLKGMITKLENVLLLKVSFQGAIQRSRQVRLSSFDEMDTAAKRVVHALLKDIKLEDTATEGFALNQDEKSRSRVKSIKGWQLGIGVANSNNTRAAGENSLWAFNLGYAWDLKDVFLEIRYDIANSFESAGDSTGSFTLGAQYLFKNFQTTSLFAGGEFGFGGITDSSFVFAGDVGAIFLRHADINLETRFRLAAFARKQEGKQSMVGTALVGLHF